MDNILIVLSLFCFVKTLLMTSLSPGKWYGVVFGCVCAVFVFCCHPYALEQNKLLLERALEGQKILTDVSLVVMADLLLTLGFSWSVLHRLAGNKRGKFCTLLGYVPSMLIFPALYYIHLNLFFSFVGTDFMQLTALLAVGCFLIITGGGAGLRYLLPETDLRLEMTVLMGFLIFILTVCCTVFHPSAMMYSQRSDIDWGGLLSTFLIIVLLFVAGYFQARIIKFFKSK